MQSLITDNDIDQINQWVKRSQQGDQAAFSQLYQHYYKKLYLFCLRMTSDTGSAEEVLQESFIKAWRGLPKFRQDSSFYTWIRQIASRLVIDKVRLKESNIWHNAVEIEESSFHSAKENHQGMGLDKAIDLEKMISLLPKGARSVFVLHDVEGYTHTEISDLIGIAQGTSKAQLTRARSLLREQLTNHKTIDSGLSL